MLASMADRAEVLEPSPELFPALVDLVPHPGARDRALSAVHGRGARYALASLGGAAVGATALALVWWRVARRPGAATAEGVAG